MRQRVWHVIAAITATTAVTDSQSSMFAGYDEFCGIRVIVVSNPQTASAAHDVYGPVIYVDPGAMVDWTASRIFTLAHECGHHKGGHVTPMGQWFRHTQFWATRSQELEADCWAGRALAEAGYHQDLERTIRDYARQGGQMQGTYPSGLERAQTIARCAGLEVPSIPTMTVPCMHPVHVGGDIVPCTHVCFYF